MHPLNDAYIRLVWARKRLAELKSVYKVYIDEEAELIGKSITVRQDHQSGNPQICYPAKIERPMPSSLPILIGEVVYHLRSSLDYPVYRLAILDSGSEQNALSFQLQIRQMISRALVRAS
jgi:hypothetical protein